MRLIFGLGNPEKKYDNTRHNTGFFLLDKIKAAGEFSDFDIAKKINARIAKGKIGDKETILIKPETFMNLSGEAVKKALAFWKLTPKDILVIHDDIDIPLGEYKIAQNSRSAGHKGVQNIIDELKTQKFTRIRIGIKTEAPVRDASDYVLEKFPKEEKGEIEKNFQDIYQEIVKII